MRDNKEENYFKVLYQISQELNSSLDFDKVLNSAMNQVIKLMRAERGFIMIKEGGKLECMVAYGIPKDKIKGGKDYSRSVIEKVLKTSQPVISFDALSDKDFSPSRSIIAMGVRSILCVPLKIKNEIIGVIYLDNTSQKGIFNHRDKEILQAFANNAAIAIENARLYKQLKESMEEKLRLQKKILEKEKEEEILKYNQQLREQIAHLIYHDMSSPLTALDFYLEELVNNSKKYMPQRDYQYLKDSKKLVNSLFAMIDSVLKVYQFEDGKIKLKIEPFDLKEMINDIISSYRIIVEPPVELLAELPNNSNVIVEGDKNIIHRIILNLLVNASKFTNEGYIKIKLEDFKDHVVIAVEDTGTGIPKEYHDKIFDKFAQAQARQKGKKLSFGLGLTFCKLAVEAHKGKIWLESEVNKGSTFFVQLPKKFNESETTEKF